MPSKLQLRACVVSPAQLEKTMREIKYADLIKFSLFVENVAL